MNILLLFKNKQSHDMDVIRVSKMVFDCINIFENLKFHGSLALNFKSSFGHVFLFKKPKLNYKSSILIPILEV